jgi:hypothetical protein
LTTTHSTGKILVTQTIQAFMTRIVLKNSQDGHSSFVGTGQVHEFVFDDIRQVDLLLYDAFHRAIPRAEFQVFWKGGQTRGVADGQGIASVRLPSDLTECSVKWRAPGNETRSDWDHESAVVITLSPADTSTGQAQRLTNLGFSGDDEQSGWLRRFQVAWGLPPTGQADPATIARLEAAAHCETKDEPQDETADGSNNEQRT